MDFSAALNYLVNLGTTYGLKVIGVIVALVVAWTIAGWLRNKLQRSLEKRNFDATLTRFFANLTRYAILVGTVLGCLGVFGIQTTSFAAVIGAAGLAIGLAFQGTLANFSAGVMLLIFRPFKVGDVVSAGGVTGKVEEIELFTTTLNTPDNRRFIVPNRGIFGGNIENLTHHPTRRVDIAVGADYAADVDRTREVLEAMVAEIPDTLKDPPPQIFLKELGASSVDWVVRVWVNTEDYWDVYQETIRRTKQALDAAGIGIPFPQMDVHFDDPKSKAMAGLKG
jgi:small conductance mechanosensitive channel